MCSDGKRMSEKEEETKNNTQNMKRVRAITVRL